MFYQLPPVGNPVCLKRQHADISLLPEQFAPYTPRFLDSGTAALAAAIQAAASLKDTATPEVILPAYGCPDLVSAAVHAGARPVLVDLERERPWMDPAGVSAAISPHTVAIVAVCLFGIPERMAVLRPLADAAGIVLIEDSAQAFPRSGGEDFWQGDLVVLSFGRGKPVSLLGGGAVLFREQRFAALLADAGGDVAVPRGNAMAMNARARLYNSLLSPRLYWIAQSLPFLHLGETRYHPLDTITPMDVDRQALLVANIEAYRRRPLEAGTGVAGLVASLTDRGLPIIDLPRSCGYSSPASLLRYPLLLDIESRDAVSERLGEQGLGASLMYPAALPAIEGLHCILGGASEFPAASEFAARILTLPLHERVSAADLDAMGACLAN
jgi:dTDP-4-amino-4,6-dideoxygalactose transaminase